MVLLPNVKWAQRMDKLFLTIDIQVRGAVDEWLCQLDGR